MTNSEHSPVAHLICPEAYPHAVQQIHLRETHISWVFLTGEFVYKVKKPVDFGFVNFSTLDRRKHFCEEELRRNRILAGDLYLEVVPISRGPGGKLLVGSSSDIVDYAVKMHQFDEAELASQMLSAGTLSPADIDELARKVVANHRVAERAIGNDWGTPELVRTPALDNMSVLRPLISSPERQTQLDQLEQWTLKRLDDFSSFFSHRKTKGFVRECHGDLHLGNIVRWRGRMIPFDCIEFNPGFYWIDVMNEVAFLVMDLDDHQRSDLGWRFLNTYLEETGDYEGLRVLPFYLVYRSLVRAKVCVLRLQQADLTETEKLELVRELEGYLDLATQYTQPRDVSLTITHGLSGSGKTYGTQQLLERTGAIRIRSDVERKRLFGLDSHQRATAAPQQGIYSPTAGQETYQQLEALAAQVVEAGFPVIVDATFLKRDQRTAFRNLAGRLGVPFQIQEFQAHPDELRRRIVARQRMATDASDATLDTLESQLQTVEPLTSQENQHVVVNGS